MDRRPTSRTLAAVSMVAAVVGGLLIWSGIGGTGLGPSAGPPAPPLTIGSVSRIDTPVRNVVAAGDDVAACREVIRPWGPEGGGSEANVLAKESDSEATWLFCDGERGSGIGTVSARSTDGTHWATQGLPIGNRNKAGDQVSVAFAGLGLASVTRESLVYGGHTHVWTNNAGKTWYAFFVSG